MLHSCKQIVSSHNVPALIQAFTLMTSLAAFFPAKLPDVFCRAKGSPKINIWLRSLNREDICVNQDLVACSGLSAEQFVGLSYERSGLDPVLLDSRRATDELVYSTRQPIVVREASRFGLIETINAPVMDSSGVLEASLHMAMVLDSSECRQEHKSCSELLISSGSRPFLQNS